jgi:hypothetical protein
MGLTCVEKDFKQRLNDAYKNRDLIIGRVSAQVEGFEGLKTTGNRPNACLVPILEMQ